MVSVLCLNRLKLPVKRGVKHQVGDISGVDDDIALLDDGPVNRPLREDKRGVKPAHAVAEILSGTNIFWMIFLSLDQTGQLSNKLPSWCYKLCVQGTATDVEQHVVKIFLLI